MADARPRVPEAAQPGLVGAPDKERPDAREEGRASLLHARDSQGDWFVREVKRCREIGMPLGCCGEWPECSHVLEWLENRRQRGVGNGPVAGRFVLFDPVDGEDVYITSWDTWDDARAAFPIEGGAILRDDETGRVWRRGYPYEWEAAST